MDLIYLGIGILIGLLIGYLIGILKNKNANTLTLNFL